MARGNRHRCIARAPPVRRAENRRQGEGGGREPPRGAVRLLHWQGRLRTLREDGACSTRVACTSGGLCDEAVRLTNFAYTVDNYAFLVKSPRAHERRTKDSQ
eukprot:3546129-Pleurochrysis_carterae.AAC.1